MGKDIYDLPNDLYDLWFEELKKRGQTPLDALERCKKMGLPQDYIDRLEEVIASKEAGRR